MTPWLQNGKDGGTELAELVCKHFYAIERVSLFHGPHSRRSPCHHFRLVTLMLTMRTRKTASFSVTPFSLLLMALFSFYRTRISSSTRAPLRHSWCVRVWKIDSYASIAGWKSRESPASSSVALRHGRTLTPR